MKHAAIFIAALFPAFSFATTIVKSKPIAAADAVVGMNKCFYAQVQAMASQFEDGKTKVVIQPPELQQFSRDSILDDDEYGSEYDIGGGRRQFVIEDLFWGDWKGCTDLNWFVGYDEDSTRFFFSKSSYCSDEQNETEPARLLAPVNTVPTVTYASANRVKAYDNAGNRTWKDDQIKGLTINIPQAKQPVVTLLNSETNHTTNVTFDTQAYVNCLKSELAF